MGAPLPAPQVAWFCPLPCFVSDRLRFGVRDCARAPLALPVPVVDRYRSSAPAGRPWPNRAMGRKGLAGRALAKPVAPARCAIRARVFPYSIRNSEHYKEHFVATGRRGCKSPFARRGRDDVFKLDKTPGPPRTRPTAHRPTAPRPRCEQTPGGSFHAVRAGVVFKLGGKGGRDAL